MELLTFKITPKSSFITPPKGDTIFGQIVSYLFLKGDRSFENYIDKEPKLVVSDMMPLGYVYKPTLPLEYFRKDDNEKMDKKELRKRGFIKLENLQNGKLYLSERVDYFQKNVTVKNSINRTTFSTDEEQFAPYGSVEINFKRELWMFVLVDNSIKSKIVETIKEIGVFGFGKDANTGRGVFDAKLIENPIRFYSSDYYMSISPTIIEELNFDNIWYEPFTRFGKFGLSNAHNNAFKKPVLMADSGMVIKSKLSEKYFGKALNNGVNGKPSFIQGYSIAIPFRLKD